ncbi:kinase [Oleisolibacter albus]|uniref:GHMP family kinase ATP-binding protein n=1 Tax=Oleisolibacter albus TaxID=2171757 RepID=UPI001EFD85F4|nr:kinase [Oleisolibacter albus]
MAINKYTYLTLRRLPPFFEHKHRIVYSRIEQVRENSEIEHPAVRAVFDEVGVSEGLEIHNDADLPARSGLGSSSAFTVGLLNVLAAQRGVRMSKQQLALEAIRIEQDVIGEAVGSQDQIWAAYGGFNRIDFQADGSFDVRPVVMPSQRMDALLGSLMLFFTGFSRFAAQIEHKKMENLEQKEKQLHEIRGLVDEAETILCQPDRSLDELGGLLHEGWMRKRSLADGVSTGSIDEIYDAALGAGAIGGKLLGAGGGGFILFYVPPEKRQSVRKRLSSLIEVDLGIDRTGSTIVMYEPNGLHRR